MERQHGSLIRASRARPTASATAETDGSGARYGLFATLAGGMADLFDALEHRVAAGAQIRLETPVARVAPSSDGSGWDVILADGSRGRFDAVVIALPAYHAAALIEAHARPLAASLCEIEYASSAIVVSGHRLDDVADPLRAFGLVVPAIENRKILAVSFSSRKFPGRAPEGRVLLRTFVGGAMQPELFDIADDEMIALVREDLRSLLGVRGGEDFAIVCRYPNAMPQYHLGHLGRVERIERLVAEHSGLELAGNAYRGVGMPDCVHSGEQAAERMVAYLRTR